MAKIESRGPGHLGSSCTRVLLYAKIPKETETEETISFFVTFLSLVAFQLGGPGYAYGLEVGAALSFSGGRRGSVGLWFEQTATPKTFLLEWVQCWKVPKISSILVIYYLIFAAVSDNVAGSSYSPVKIDTYDVIDCAGLVT